MNASIGCLGLGMIVLFFTTCFFIRESNKHIAELKKELEEVKEFFNYLRKDMLSMDDDLEQTKCAFNDIKNKLENSEKSFDIASRLKGIEGSLKGMLDLMEQERTERLNERYEEAARQTRALYETNLASAHAGDNDEPYADIPGDLDDGFEGEEPATDEQREALEYANKKVRDKANYKWIFPSEDPASTPIPIVGDEYLVIGSDKSYSGFKADLVSGVGVWKGLGSKPWSCGFDMDEGYKLDKVYAYIRLPSPSDVMEKILDIRSKEE